MIVVEYLDRHFKKKKQIFRDFEAQIIQHEIDHFFRNPDLTYQILINPVIVDHSKQSYETEEGFLSLTGNDLSSGIQ